MKKRNWTIGILLIGLLVTIGVVYIATAYSGSTKAVLTIIAPYDGATVYINEKESGSISNQTFTSTISRGTHSIIVSHDGLFPWSKQFEVDSGEQLTMHPFLFSRNTRGFLIPQNDPEYTTIRNTVENSILPTRDMPLRSPQGDIFAFIDDGALVVSWNGTSTPPRSFCSDEVTPCSGEKQIVKPIVPITSVGFLDNWNDVVIFSTNTDILAIEIDTRIPQNFQPLYRGSNVRFSPGNDGSLYVLNGDTLEQIIP